MASHQEIFATLSPSTTVRSLDINMTTRPSSNLAGNVNCLNNRSVDLVNNLTNQVSDQYSVDLLYWRNGHNILSDHPIFGEDTDSEFVGPYAIKGLVKINSSVSMLETFGLTTDEDLDLFIAFDEWLSVFPDNNPIAGDRFQLRYLYCDSQSPSGFTELSFQVTSQGDGELTSIFMQQKYYWNIKAKRADFSWQTNEPKEANSNNIFDGDHQGTVEGTGDTPTTETGEDSVDNNDIDTLARENFDAGSKTTIFGKYH